jgi:hypothetical protein
MKPVIDNTKNQRNNKQLTKPDKETFMSVKTKNSETRKTLRQWGVEQDFYRTEWLMSYKDEEVCWGGFPEDEFCDCEQCRVGWHPYKSWADYHGFKEEMGDLKTVLKFLPEELVLRMPMSAISREATAWRNYQPTKQNTN